MENFITIISGFNIVKEILLLLIVMIFSNQALPQTFAVIGDYGSDDTHELDVANLVKSWNPDFYKYECITNLIIMTIEIYQIFPATFINATMNLCQAIQP